MKGKKFKTESPISRANSDGVGSFLSYFIAKHVGMVRCRSA